MKQVRVKDLSGRLDRRSMTDAVGWENFRLLLNMSVRARGKRCRRGGWKRLLDGHNVNYNNEDLHDQLIGLQTYYESFETWINQPAEVDGVNYAYQWPSTAQSAYSLTTNFGLIYGYPPDLISAYGYDYPPSDGYGLTIYSWTVDPIYPDQSTSELVYVRNFSATGSAAYGYGPLSYSYTDPNSYLYQYCGTYPYVRTGCEEHINLITSVGSTQDVRTLIVGTRSRLYALNSATGNWKIIADGLGSVPLRQDEDCDGCSPERWLTANIQNEIVFTNGVNPPLIYNPLSQPTGCNLWRATNIQDLEDLDISSAGCVGSWKGFVFFGDVYQNGARRGNRIIWSDYQDPRGFIPSDDSLAGFQDLGQDEIILRIEPINDFLFIFTSSSIYRAALIQTGDEQQATFVFEEIYRGDDALHFKYSLVNTGDAIYYWTADRLLRITSFDKRPIEIPWMRAVSNAVFDGVVEDDLSFSAINRDACNQFIGGWNSQFKELWWSWPTGESSCPTMSLVFNTTNGEEGADFVDHGFTAFHWWRGQRTSTLFEAMEELQMCTREQLLGDLQKEGDPYETVYAGVFDNPVLYIWNDTEDITQPAGPDSLCEALTRIWLRDWCDDCDTINKFVMASATDKCLKEYADKAYYRERLQSSLYVLDGYSSVIQSGSDDLQDFGEKTVMSISVTFTADPQTTPNTLYAYLGYGPGPDCIRWELQQFYDDCSTLVDGNPLECFTENSEAVDDDNWTRPDSPAVWPTHVTGKNLAYRLKITGTGGGSCFSNVVLTPVKTG